MNLNQLRYAWTLAETRSFTRAAELCSVSQPALSKAVAQLEEQLGARLFDRTTKQFELTPFGRALLPFVERVLSAHDELTRRAMLEHGRITLRIGVSTLVRASVLSTAINRLRSETPGVEVVLSEANMADLHRRLGGGELDLIVAPGVTHRTGWQRRLVYNEPLWLVPRAGRSLDGALGDGVRITAVAEETFVMVPDTWGLARATRELFESRGLRLREYPGEALGFGVLQEWVGLGLGAAIVPRSKVEVEGAVPLLDEAGNTVTIAIEALFTDEPPPQIAALVRHLETPYGAAS
jgi:LysR family hydrogen peroxide-inducible transcriptional activator